MPWNVSVWTVELWRPVPLNTSSATHHVVPQALGQLFMPLYGEVEAVVSEEGHIDFPILLGDTKHSQLTECDLSKASSSSCRTRQLRESVTRLGVTLRRDSSADMTPLRRCLPAGVEDQLASGRAEALRQSLPWRSGCCSGASPVVSINRKKQLVYKSQSRITRLVQTPLRKGWMRQSDSGFLMVEDDLRYRFPW